MDDWESRILTWILLLSIFLHSITGYSLFCLSEQVDKNERRLEQLEQIHHEQVE